MKKTIALLIVGLISSSLFADGWSDMRKSTGAKVTTKKSKTVKSSKDDRFKKSDKKAKKEIKKKERKPLW